MHRNKDSYACIFVFAYSRCLGRVGLASGPLQQILEDELRA
jgi:hypothetical protein